MCTGLDERLNDFWRLPVPDGGVQEGFAQALRPQGRQHVRKRRFSLLTIPGAVRKATITMPVTRKPQDDQCVKQHRHLCGSLHGLSRPALRLLEAQAALALLKRRLHGPAHAIPAQHLDGIRIGAGRVKRLRLAAAAGGLHGHHTQQTRPGRAIPQRLSVVDASGVVPTVDVQLGVSRPLSEHLTGTRQPLAF